MLETGTTVSADSAIRVLERAREVAESYFGFQDSTVAIVLEALAKCHHKIGRHYRCDALLTRSIEIWETGYGARHPRTGRCLVSLGACQRGQQLYAQAEATLERAVRILGDGGKPYREQLAIAHDNLGLLYQILDRYDEAEYCYHQSMDNWKKAGCVRCWGEAKAHLQLGVISLVRGDYVEAENRYETSLLIFEDLLGPDHRMVAYTLGALGEIFAVQGRFDDAMPYALRAVEASKQIRSTDPVPIIRHLTLLADIEYVAGRLHNARSHYEEALRAAFLHLSSSHPLVTNIERSLATIEYVLGNDDRSVELLIKSRENNLLLLRDVLPYAPEGLKLWFVNGYNPIDNVLLNIAAGHRDGPSHRMALEMILRGKGLILDVVTKQSIAMACSNDPELERLGREHSEICARIANTTLSGTRERPAPESPDNLQRLYEQKDALEAELGRHCAAFVKGAAGRDFSTDDVAAALPTAGRLIEFVTYQPIDLRPDRIEAISDQGRRFVVSAVPDESHVREAVTGPRRYLAFCLDPDGEIVLTDIGETAPIDSLITACLEAIAGYPSEQYGLEENEAEVRLAAITGELYRRLIDPLHQALADCEKLLISPDGELNRLPFELVRTPSGRYLIEDFELSYLTSGRDLLLDRMIPAANSRHPIAIVLSDPAFDQKPEVVGQPFAASQTARGPSLLGRGTEVGSCLEGPFYPLPSTLIEGTEVTSVLESTGLYAVSHYTGSDASEATLRRIDSPAILHIATHGFWCPLTEFRETPTIAANPLLRSGLALAGVNARTMDRWPLEENSPWDDGILTALEASSLPLVGTDLVVLSGCQTGIGEVRNGEGIFGLRRTFQQAGAQSLIMSMFEILDETATELMPEFYRRWISGAGKAGALRGAALKVLRERRERYGNAHPLYWAGFVLVGNPN